VQMYAHTYTHTALQTVRLLEGLFTHDAVGRQSPFTGMDRMTLNGIRTCVCIVVWMSNIHADQNQWLLKPYNCHTWAIAHKHIVVVISVSKEHITG